MTKYRQFTAFFKLHSNPHPKNERRPGATNTSNIVAVAGMASGQLSHCCTQIKANSQKGLMNKKPNKITMHRILAYNCVKFYRG